MDIKSLITIEELPTVGSTNPKQEYLLVQTPEKTGKMPLSNLPSEASKIGFDNKGTNLSSNTVQAAITELDSSLTANNTQFIYDYQDGKYGYNTDPNRGADTFHPFSSKPETVRYYGNWTATHRTTSGSIDLPTIRYKYADITTSGAISCSTNGGTNIDISGIDIITMSWNVDNGSSVLKSSGSYQVILHD